MSAKINDRPKNLLMNRAVVVATSLCGFLALQFTSFSVQETVTHPSYFVDQNLGRGFIIAYAILPLILSARYPLYWVFFNKDEKAQADERQRNVRRRVYETAYRYFAVASILAYWVFNNPSHGMALIMWWFIGITFFMMPILVAAWQKDS